MEPFEEITRTLSLTMGAAWASGINLYAAVLVLGLLGKTGNMVLPPNLEILMHPLVLGAAGIMYAVEFFADKIPGIDTGWDTIHTFIRIPAGVMLAAGAVGEVNPAVAIAAGILGGGLAAGAHAAKAGSRVIINASPEPFTNIGASVMEDVAVIGGLWAALHYPVAFIAAMVVFVLLLAWLLPKLWKGIRKIFGWLGRKLGMATADEIDGRLQPDAADGPSPDIEARIEQLKRLLDKNLITPEEFSEKKAALLKSL